MKQTVVKNNIPLDWVEIELGKLVDEKRPVSYGIVQTGEPVEGGIPCIRVTDIIDGKIDTSNLITTSQKISDGYKRTLLKKGDLVMALRGKIGQIAKIGDELVGANLTRGVALIALKDNYCGDFILQQISSDRTIKVFERSLNGSALQELSIGVVRKIPIILPKSLTEQQSIASILKSCDEVIGTTEKLIAQKELRKKWLMQQLLTGKKRLKGFGGEWKEKKLGALFSHLRETNDGGDGHSIMTISAKLGLVSQEDKFDRIIAGESLKKYTQLSKGDFAYNKGNSKTFPMGCIYRLEENESALVPFVYICFRPSDKVDGMFYKQWFMAHGLDSQLNKIITSGARGDGLLNVNTDDFFKLKVPYPPIEEQTAIAQVLQAADKEISLLKAKAEKLREQKKGLMQQLLTGKVRLKIK